MADYRRLILPNGLRVLLEQRGDSSSVAVSLTVSRGSRHEPADLCGITHFIEHMLFKGTARRDVLQLAREINLQGGYMNASTGNDMFRVYTYAVPEDLEAALELLADMTWNSSFPAREVERERGVILEEIAEYLDSPEDLCFENMLQKLWLPHPLGRPILGTPETVGRFTREMLLEYWSAIRHPSNLILSLAGGIDFAEAQALAERLFAGPQDGAVPVPVVESASGHAGRIVVERDMEQVQFCLGLEGIARHDERRHAMAVLDTIFGGGIGSRLFNEIREKRGLAYTIASSYSCQLAEGNVSISGATSAESLEEVLALCRREIELLCGTGPTAEELDTAKRQLTRGLLLAMESNGFRAARNADAEHYGESRQTAEEVIERVRAISADQVQSLAIDVLGNHDMAISLVGPVAEMAAAERALSA